MIRKWLKKLFTEAWKDYERSFPCETTAQRDPLRQDIKSRDRRGHVWTNRETKQVFYLDLVWKKKSGRKKGTQKNR